MKGVEGPGIGMWSLHIGRGKESPSPPTPQGNSGTVCRTHGTIPHFPHLETWMVSTSVVDVHIIVGEPFFRIHLQVLRDMKLKKNECIQFFSLNIH